MYLPTFMFNENINDNILNLLQKRVISYVRFPIPLFTYFRAGRE